MKQPQQTSLDSEALAVQLDLFSAMPPSKGAEYPAQPENKLKQSQLINTSSSQTLSSLSELFVNSSAVPGKRQILLQGCTLEYRLLRSKRQSIGFLIDEDGLRITAPRWVTIADIESAIRNKQRWIVAKLIERRARSARRLQAPMQWCDGTTLPYLGQDLTLRILSTQAVGVAHDALKCELTISLPSDASEQQLKDRVQGWLQSEATRIFAERLPVYAQKLNVRYQSFALSSATTQWGSCTADGRIRLNWRLIHFALPQIDYVIAHELAHLREMNHSARFWATVQSVFPEFQAAKKMLRECSPEILPLF